MKEMWIKVKFRDGKKYSRFRSHLLGKRAEKRSVLENHFKKIGIDDIDQLKNHPG